MHVLEAIKEMIYDEIECVAEKGQISNGSTLEVIDKLTHSLKSIETILAMEGYGENEDEYSRRGGRGNYSYGYRGNSQRGERMMDNNGGQYNSSYRSGRYSRGRYSRDDGKEKMLEKLEDYMEMTNSDKTRDAIKKLMEQVQSED